MGAKERRKGADGERELAAFFRSYGIASRRGCQFGSGSEDNPDVIGPPGFHTECKRVEALRLAPAYAQAVSDAGARQIPIVCHRSSRQPWMVSLSLADFMETLGYLPVSKVKIESNGDGE